MEKIMLSSLLQLFFIVLFVKLCQQLTKDNFLYLICIWMKQSYDKIIMLPQCVLLDRSAATATYGAAAENKSFTTTNSGDFSGIFTLMQFELYVKC